MIYECALVAPKAIDLCPHSFIDLEAPDILPPAVCKRIESWDRHRNTGPEIGPTLRKPGSRSAADSTCTCIQFRPPKSGDARCETHRWGLAHGYDSPTFRDQADVRFVREKLALGLLSTCQQVRYEAWSYFWTCNVFRFSDEGAWVVFLRFVNTIGVSAVRKIGRLELLHPLAYTWWGQLNISRIKNEPKLGLIKTGVNHDSDYHAIQQVVDLIEGSGSCWRLTLVVPRKFEFNDWRSTQFRGSDEDSDVGDFEDLSQRLLEVAQCDLVIESGGMVNCHDGDLEKYARMTDLASLSYEPEAKVRDEEFPAMTQGPTTIMTEGGEFLKTSFDHCGFGLAQLYGDEYDCCDAAGGA